MKTVHATTINTAMNRLTRAHLIMAIAGIMIAIICAWVVLHDVNVLQHEAMRSVNTAPSKAAIGEQIVTLTKFSMQAIVAVLK
jgi:hypothetical protein